jgi:predicted O-methyltransferase YrrM
MDTLDYILNKFKLSRRARSPIEIPNYGRFQLVNLFAELGFKIGAEIGVFRGQYAEAICKANPTVELYLVDSWQNYDDFYIRGMEGAKAEALQRLEGYNTHVMHMTSEEAMKQIPDESLDFVYIDGNHEWLYVAQDLYWWSKKVRTGGIIAGHDFKKLRSPHSNMHASSVVWGFTDAYQIKPWFLLGTRAKTPGLIRDKSRTYMWVKVPVK